MARRMITYPSIPWQYGQREGGPGCRPMQKVVAIGGAPHWRITGSRRRNVITLVHPRITRAQRDSIWAFFDTNNAPFLFSRARNGITETLTVFFDGEPEESFETGGTWTLTVKLAVI